MRHICAPVENAGAADRAFCVSAVSVMLGITLAARFLLWQLCAQQFLEDSNACVDGERLVAHTTWLWRLRVC
jgi:hypothetical protein